LGGLTTVYVCTGQQGVNEKEAAPRNGVIVLSNDLKQILSVGEMQICRSMHKQVIVMNRIFITGGAIINNKNIQKVASKQCEEIVLSPDYAIMNAKMKKMNSKRRNHGICSIIRNNKMGIIVGFGENSKRDDNNTFEYFDFDKLKWYKLNYKNELKICWPGLIQINNDTMLIMGGWDNKPEVFTRIQNV